MSVWILMFKSILLLLFSEQPLINDNTIYETESITLNSGGWNQFVFHICTVFLFLIRFLL